MQFLTIFTNTLILIIGSIVFFEWIRRLQKNQATPKTAPLRMQNGRFHHNQSMPDAPHQNMKLATRDLVVDSMNDGMIVLDDQNCIVDINLAARRIIQLSMVNLLGKPIDQVLPMMARQLQAAKTKPIDIALGEKDTERFYEVSNSPFHGGREQQPGRLIVLRDVTERKKLENERDDMTRTMVHDLRDPISNSLFALEMLKTSFAESGSPDSQELLDLTFASTAKTLQLVDKILEIGRLESGETPLFPTSISLMEIVDTVLIAQAPRAADKKLQLVNAVPQSLPPVWADADLLERVLRSLVDNSLKFTPVAGEIRVTAVLHQDDKSDEPRLLVSVSDSGPGISTGLQSKLFEQFVTGTHAQSGAGLGLAFCKMALAAHGQRIWVDSTPEQGSTFTFSLPISPAIP